MGKASRDRPLVTRRSLLGKNEYRVIHEGVPQLLDVISHEISQRYKILWKKDNGENNMRDKYKTTKIILLQFSQMINTYCLILRIAANSTYAHIESPIGYRIPLNTALRRVTRAK